METLVRTDGSELTRQEAVLCNSTLWGKNVYHDWLYLREEHEYKCRRCQVKIKKSELKALTDGE